MTDIATTDFDDRLRRVAVEFILPTGVDVEHGRAVVLRLVVMMIVKIAMKVMMKNSLWKY